MGEGQTFYFYREKTIPINSYLKTHSYRLEY